MSKLDDAKVIVDELKRKAAEQSVILAEKQTEADAALVEITTSMQVMAPVPSLSCYVLSGWSLSSLLLSLHSHCHHHCHHCYHHSHYHQHEYSRVEPLCSNVDVLN